MKEGKQNLREIATVLNLNYSTAKTILQTFRKEKRIAKRPRCFVETKNAIKHERNITSFLTKNKVYDLMNEVLLTEYNPVENNDAFHKKSLDGCSDSQSSMQTHPESLKKINSSSQFPSSNKEEKGKYVSIGVTVNMVDTTFRRDIFFVYSDVDPDEFYKGKINYDDFLNPKIYQHSENHEGKHSDIFTLKKCTTPFGPFNFEPYVTKILQLYGHKATRNSTNIILPIPIMN